MENLDPPPPPPTPNQGLENGAFFPLRDFILDLGGGDGGLLFHFILSKIVVARIRRQISEFFPILILKTFNMIIWNFVKKGHDLRKKWAFRHLFLL